jgi:hypothetical protein
MRIHSGHIEVAVANLFGYRQHLIVPNVSWGWDLRHEADMIIVNPANKVTEVEIKISIADLKADFKKQNGHQSKKIGRLYYAFPVEMLEKALLLIPNDCGIITVRTRENGTYVASFYKMVKYDKSINPITDMQRIKLGDLGCMRIWSLKTALYNKQK